MCNMYVTCKAWLQNMKRHHLNTKEVTLYLIQCPQTIFQIAEICFSVAKLSGRILNKVPTFKVFKEKILENVGVCK